MPLNRRLGGVALVDGRAELIRDLPLARALPGPRVGPALVLRRALPADVPALLDLLGRYAQLGLVQPRAPEALYRQFREYVVAVEGGEIVGCAGLRIYHQALAEVVGVAVREECQGRGVGRQVVSAVIDEARLLSIPRIFALTLQVPFFQQLGFHTAPLAEVPEKVAADLAEGIDRARCMKTTMVRDLDR
jgi:amino-acid N-acetyltransferase